MDLAGLPASALLSSQPWLLAGATSLGGASAIAAVGLAGIALGPRLPAWAPLVGAVLVSLSFALTGHAATAPPRWLTGPALGLHVLCAAFWLGSLLPLLWSLRLEPAEACRVLRRFSLVALVAVAVLVAAGSTLAWIQLGGDLGALDQHALWLAPVRQAGSGGGAARARGVEPPGPDAGAGRWEPGSRGAASASPSRPTWYWGWPCWR